MPGIEGGKGEGTVRQRMIELLKLRPHDSLALARELDITERQAETHLRHVLKSVAGQGLALEIEDSRCLECGFVFSGRERTTRPSRCPKCKNEDICRPSYFITRPKKIN